MKKNVMMRVASVLLIAVMMTTCAISGTFAKYVTSGEATDSARVAKWGVTITGSTGLGNNMFSVEYPDNDGLYNGLSVAATVNVIAPGTSGTFTNFDIDGVPEVATRITYAPVVEISGYWFDGAANFYCPIVVTVNSEIICGLAYDDPEDFETAIETAIGGATKDYAPGSISLADSDLNISWAWAFEAAVHTCDDTHKIEQTDGKDTFLGDWAKKGNATPEISVAITCTVTQID